MDDKDTIKELFTSAIPFAEETVVKILKPLIVIHEESWDIHFVKENLSTDEKVLAYALAKKLLAAKGYISEKYISAIQVHKNTGIPKGSIDSAFKHLRENGYLMGNNQAYEIPNYKILKVVELLSHYSK